MWLQPIIQINYWKCLIMNNNNDNWEIEKKNWFKYTFEMNIVVASKTFDCDN